MEREKEGRIVGGTLRQFSNICVWENPLWLRTELYVKSHDEMQHRRRSLTVVFLLQETSTEKFPSGFNYLCSFAVS